MRAETLLNCAMKAFPEYHWHVDHAGGGDVFCTHIKVDSLENPIKLEPQNWLHFTLETAHDQMALQIALEKEGWQFWWWNDEFYASQYETDTPDVKTSNTKPALLAACVESTQE